MGEQAEGRWWGCRRGLLMTHPRSVVSSALTMSPKHPPEQTAPKAGPAVATHHTHRDQARAEERQRRGLGCGCEQDLKAARAAGLEGVTDQGLEPDLVDRKFVVDERTEEIPNLQSLARLEDREAALAVECVVLDARDVARDERGPDALFVAQIV